MKKLLLAILLIVPLVLVCMRVVLPGFLERSMNRVQEHSSYKLDAKAEELHRSLFVVDLHTDSLLWDRDLAQRSGRGHVDIPRLQEGNVALQVFSATTKSPRGQNYDRNDGGTDNITLLSMVQGWPVRTWGSLFARAEYQLERLLDLAAARPDALMLVRYRKDLETLISRREAGERVVGAMYLIEGAHPLEGQVDNLDRLHTRGLHFVGLTHFFDNALGGSLHGISGEGLTPFGRDVVRRADQLGMTIDIAHASPRMVRDVLALTDRPVILSHGGFKGQCDTARNLEDALMQEVAARGGIVGVGFWAGAVCDPSPAGIVQSIRYGIDLLGLEHVALGSDYDGTVLTPFDVSEIGILTQAMLDAGFTDAEIRAVMGENMKRFLLRQLPAGA